MLESSLGGAPVAVTRKDVVDACMGIAAACSQARFDELGIFADEPDVKHGSKKRPKVEFGGAEVKSGAIYGF